MQDMTIRPEAVEVAAAWIAGHRHLYNRAALDERLAEVGYSPAEISAAWMEVESPSADIAGGTNAPDLRTKAAAILMLGFFGTWGVMTLILVMPNGSYTDYGGLASLILGGILGVVALVSLIAIAASGRLRSGAEGALAAILTVPFVLLVIVAGLCVATTNGLRV